MAAISAWRTLTAGQHRALVANGLIHALNDGYVACIFPVLPLVAEEFGASYAVAGMVKLGLSGALGAFELPVALLAERVGETAILTLGSAGLALGFAGLGLVGALWQVVALATLGGAAAAGQHPLSSSVVARAYEQRGRSTAISTLNFTGDVGKAVFPILWGWLAVIVGWRQAMVVLGLVGLPLAGLFALLSRGAVGPARHPTSAPTQGWGILDGRRFAALTTIGILDSVVRGGALTLLAFLLVQKGLDTPTSAAVFTAIFVAGAVGKFGCGPLGARFGAVGVIAMTELATGLAVLAFVPAPPAVLFALAVVFGFFLNGTSSVLYASVSELLASDRQG